MGSTCRSDAKKTRIDTYTRRSAKAVKGRPAKVDGLAQQGAEDIDNGDQVSRCGDSLGRGRGEEPHGENPRRDDREGQTDLIFGNLESLS